MPHCLNVQVFRPNILKPSTRKKTFILIGWSEGFSAPSQYVLYVDKSADDIEIRRLAHFFHTNYGVDAQASKKAEMRDESSRNQLQIEIPGILKYQVRPLPATPLSDTVRDYLYSWLVKPEQWRTRIVKYRASENNETIEYKRTNSLVAEFRLGVNDLQQSPTGSSNPLRPAIGEPDAPSFMILAKGGRYGPCRHAGFP